MALLLTLLLFVSVSAAQNALVSSPVRTEVYRIHFVKAAIGKVVEEVEYLQKPDPKAPMPGQLIVLRHQDGEDWDFVTIEHIGAKAIVEAGGNQKPGTRDIDAWHDETFVSGPAWPVFAQAMGIDEGSTAKSARSAYVVSVYRAAPEHYDQLEKALSQLPPGGTSAGHVVMQQLEGGPWDYLTISRYSSWQDFATNEKNTIPDTLNPKGGWFPLREYSSYHNDTLTDRIVP